MHSEEYLEYGIIVGYKIALLESQGKISFTESYDFDDGFLKLARELVKEFRSDACDANYFSAFVEKKLIEMDSIKQKTE